MKYLQVPTGLWRWVLVGTLAAVVAGCGGCASLPPSKPTYRAAARIEFQGGGLCSATAVGPYTLLSAAHCFTGKRAGVMKVNGEGAEYAVIADDGSDHVLVRIGRRQGHVAEIGPKPKWGQMLSMIGNPVGFYSLLRMGRVAGWESDFVCPDETTMGCKVLLADMETTGGDSGSGYFNARGQVVGVHSGSVMKGVWSLAYSYPLAFLPGDYAKIQ